MNIKHVVIYHSADFDGLCCREIAKKAFGESAIYIGWDYGDPVPITPAGSHLYMLDISIDVLMNHPKLVWIDHHRSAIKKYGDSSIAGIRVDGVAACRQVWFYFNERSSDHQPTKEYFDGDVRGEPLAVRLIGEHDVWNHRDPRAELLQHGLRSVDLDSTLTVSACIWWEKLLSPGTRGEKAIARLLERGDAIRFYKESQDAKVMARQAFLLQFEGLKFIAANLSPGFNSSAFDSVISQYPEADAVMGCSHNGKEWAVSMYGIPTKPDIDLSSIAVQLGGGGHKQACGFRTRYLPWINSMTHTDEPYMIMIHTPKGEGVLSIFNGSPIIVSARQI